MAQIYDRGNPEPKRERAFHVEVSDDGEHASAPGSTRYVRSGTGDGSDG